MRLKCLIRKGGGVISAVIFYCCLGLIANAPARAATGYDPIDDAAIMVKFPTQTDLVTIIRAGQRLLAVGEHGVIIYSDDSGANWKQAKVPVDTLLTDVVFTSDLDGWAVGHFGVIIHSTNGGLIWNMALNGLDVIQAAKDASAQLQAKEPGTPQAALELRVANAYSGVGPSKPFLSVGRCGGGLLAAGQQDMAMYTPDDGKTWQQWTSNILNPQFNNIYAVLARTNSTFLIGEAGTVLKSDADCMNFKPVPGPFSATLFGGRLLGTGAILVFGLDGSLFFSSDDGTTWQTLSVPTDELIDTSVELPSGQILLGTLSGHFYLSDAVVSTFHRLGAYEPFQVSGMALAPNGNVVVVGNGGVAILDKREIH